MLITTGVAVVTPVLYIASPANVIAHTDTVFSFAWKKNYLLEPKLNEGALTYVLG